MCFEKHIAPQKKPRPALFPMIRGAQATCLTEGGFAPEAESVYWDLRPGNRFLWISRSSKQRQDMDLLIVSGDRGEGKTTFVRKFAASMTDCGRSVGGVASPAVFEAGMRIGYDLINLLDGTRQILARIARPGEEPTVGAFRFASAAVASGISAILSAVRDELDLIAIDEVGPWEFRGGGWAPALEEVLRNAQPCQTLIVVVRPLLVDELPRRFPSPMWEGARRIQPPWPKLSEEE